MKQLKAPPDDLKLFCSAQYMLSIEKEEETLRMMLMKDVCFDYDQQPWLSIDLASATPESPKSHAWHCLYNAQDIVTLEWISDHMHDIAFILLKTLHYAAIHWIREFPNFEK